MHFVFFFLISLKCFLCMIIREALCGCPASSKILALQWSGVPKRGEFKPCSLALAGNESPVRDTSLRLLEDFCSWDAHFARRSVVAAS